MSMSILTNQPAMSASKAMNRAGGLLDTAMTRLATGLCINRAADNASGMQIATRLSTQSRAMGVAKRNAGNASALLQTAEGAFEEVKNIAQKMKDLATQSANQTETLASRQALQAEFAELQTALKSIIDDTTFGGEKLFGTDGKLAQGISLQVGSSADETMNVVLEEQFNTLDDVLTKSQAAKAAVTTASSGTPSQPVETEESITDLKTQPDFKKIKRAFKKQHHARSPEQANTGASVTLTTTRGSGTNADPETKVETTYEKLAGDRFKISTVTTTGIINAAPATPGRAAINTATLIPAGVSGTPTQDEYTQAAQAAIQGLEALLDSANAIRATIGGTMNRRLSHTVANLNNMQENTDLAVGTIMDADMGKASSILARNEVLKQASVVMLKKAQKSVAHMVSMLLQN